MLLRLQVDLQVAQQESRHQEEERDDDEDHYLDPLVDKVELVEDFQVLMRRIEAPKEGKKEVDAEVDERHGPDRNYDTLLPLLGPLARQVPVQCEVFYLTANTVRLITDQDRQEEQDADLHGVNDTQGKIAVLGLYRLEFELAHGDEYYAELDAREAYPDKLGQSVFAYACSHHEDGDDDEDYAIDPADGLVQVFHVRLVVLEVLPCRLADERSSEARVGCRIVIVRAAATL